ncbi:Spindle pole body component [Trichinella pseudospiralis]
MLGRFLCKAEKVIKKKKKKEKKWRKNRCSLPLYNGGEDGGEQQALFELLRGLSVQNHADVELNHQKLAQMHGDDPQQQRYVVLQKKFAQLENMFDKIGRHFDDLLCLTGRYSLDPNLLCLPSNFIALTSHLKVANDFVQIWEQNLIEMKNRADKMTTIFWLADLTECRDKFYSANLASILAQVRSKWWSNLNNLENVHDVFDDLPNDQQHQQEAVVQFCQENEILRQKISSYLHSIGNISTDCDLVPILKAIAAVQDAMLSDYEQVLKRPQLYVGRLIADVESTLIYSDKFCEIFSTLVNNLLKVKQLLENAAQLKASFLESEAILKRNLTLLKMVVEPTMTTVDQCSQETASWHLASEINVNNFQKRVDELVDIYCRCSSAVVDLESKDLKSLHKRETQLHARLNDLDDLYDLATTTPTRGRFVQFHCSTKLSLTTDRLLASFQFLFHRAGCWQYFHFKLLKNQFIHTTYDVSVGESWNSVIIDLWCVHSYFRSCRTRWTLSNILLRLSIAGCKRYLSQ